MPTYPLPVPDDFIPLPAAGSQAADDFILDAACDDDAMESLLEACERAFPHSFREACDPDDVAAYVPGPLALHDRWHARLAAGDEYALSVARACDLWQAEQDAQRELRHMRRQYKEALGRNDSAGASKLWHAIQHAKAARRSARRQE